MTESEPQADRFTILLDLGATAGPYTYQELVDQLETGRAGPDDRVSVESSGQKLKIRQVIAHADEIHGRRKSDRIRRRSDRIAIAQANEARKSDRLPVATDRKPSDRQPAVVVADGKAVERTPVVSDRTTSDRLAIPDRKRSDRLTTPTADRRKTSDRLPAAEGERRRTSDRMSVPPSASPDLVKPLQLLLVVLVVITAGIYGVQGWEDMKSSQAQMPVAEALGTWELDPSQSQPSNAQNLPAEQRQALQGKLKGLVIALKDQDITVTTSSGRTSSPWTLVGTTPNSMAIKCVKPDPNLGETLIFVRSAGGLTLNLMAGDWPLRRRP